MAVEFTAATVMTMLGAVLAFEAAQVGLALYFVRKLPSSEDVDDVEETAEVAAEQAAEASHKAGRAREHAEQAHSRIDAIKP